MKSQFEILFGLQLGLCVAIFLATAALLRSPTTASVAVRGKEERHVVSPRQEDPPSLASATEQQESAAAPPSQWAVTRRVCRTAWSLGRNHNFLLLLLAFSVTTGSVYSLASLLAPTHEPCGTASEQPAGISGAGNVLLGTCVAYAVGRWDRTHQYKYPLLICLTGSLVIIVVLIVIFASVPPCTNIIRVVCVLFVISAGASQITAVPLCFELGMELSFPSGESVPGALMMGVSNLISLIILITASAIIGDDNTVTTSTAVYVLVLILSMSVCGCLCVCFTRERLHRRAAAARSRPVDHEMEPYRTASHRRRRRGEASTMSPAVNRTSCHEKYPHMLGFIFISLIRTNDPSNLFHCIH